MFSVFMFAINAIVPLVLLIVLGYVLKCAGFLDEAFLKTGNKLVFRVCLPCSLFCNVYAIENFSAMNWDIVLFAVAALAVIYALALLYVLFFVPQPKQKGVVLQCAYRSNFALIGIPLTEALGGVSALGAVSVLSAITIPLYNIAAVITLSLFVEKQEKPMKMAAGVLKKIVTNPLIIGTFAGFFCVIVRSFLPVNGAGNPVFTLKDHLYFVYHMMEFLSRMATPLALLVLGGQFTFQAVRGMWKEIVMGTAWRLLFAPAIGIGGAVLLSNYTSLVSFTPVQYPALVALFASPVAVSSAIMAGEMGNDDQLAGQLVVWTSIGAVPVLFVITMMMRAGGLL